MCIVRDTHLVLYLAEIVLVVCKTVFYNAEDILPAVIVLECEVGEIVLLHIVGVSIDDHVAAADTVVVEAALILLRFINQLEYVVRSATVALGIEVQP